MGRAGAIADVIERPVHVVHSRLSQLLFHGFFLLSSQPGAKWGSIEGIEYVESFLARRKAHQTELRIKVYGCWAKIASANSAMEYFFTRSTT